MLGGGPGIDLVLGGGGNAELYGGPGPDQMRGSGGDDYIDAVDGEVDVVTCGGGTDTVEADTADTVDEATCETINRQ